MKVAKEILNKKVIPSSAEATVNSVNTEDSCVIKMLEREMVEISAKQNKANLVDKIKLKSSNEAVFCDVVTRCYIRGYN